MNQREQIIREVANYIGPAFPEAAKLALEVIAARIQDDVKIEINSMNLIELKKRVIAIAVKYNFLEKHTVLHCSVYDTLKPNHSCHVWDPEKKCFIESSHHQNYDAMLEQFEDKLIQYRKKYSTHHQNIDL